MAWMERNADIRDCGWRGFYVNKHHEMASKADAVIAFLKQNISSESVEVNHYLVAMQNMNAMQFGFKDVVLFFFKEDRHVLLILADYCYFAQAKLNEAFDSVENGCARMASKTGGFVDGGNWKYEHGTAHYGHNFGVRWLKLCELSFHKTRHLRNPYNENLPMKISRDCQELEPSIGEQLASLLYLEPDSELMVLFLLSVNVYGNITSSRSKTRRAKSKKQKELIQKTRLKIQILFHLRTMKRNKRKKVRKMKTPYYVTIPGGGFGMMMGPGPRRGPFIGSAGRGARPPFSQQQQPLQSSQNSAHSKRDQPSGGGSQTMGQDRPDDETQPGDENTFENGESKSEDEALRRSRHGEGNKKGVA
ncbi:30-kDa cleavage and polyadenylation specificity factor 30 [Tanacetum coccineum]